MWESFYFYEKNMEFRQKELEKKIKDHWKFIDKQ
jgi:hypothetical protein